MAVFIGKQVSLTYDKHRRPTVTFEVLEPLWGLDGVKKATIFFVDGYGESTAPQFLAVTPGADGRYRHDDCGAGILRPIEHPWVREFKQNVREGREARISLRVVASGHVPVDGATARLAGGGGVFEVRTGGFRAWMVSRLPASLLSMLETIGIPPGRYQAAVNRPGFRYDATEPDVSILPGSCAPVRLRMTSESRVSGRVLTSNGRAVVNASFHLMGQARSGRREYSASGRVITDDEGRFTFDDVFPGRYYLVSDLGEVNRTFGRPLPRTYYPGVRDWPQATQLAVPEGGQVSDVIFRLPDFGDARRLEVRVVSEDGAPIRGAVVRDGNIAHAERAASIGEQRITDAMGRVTLDVWANCEYGLSTYFYPPGRVFGSEQAHVPAGSHQMSIVLRLRGLEMRKQR